MVCGTRQALSEGKDGRSWPPRKVPDDGRKANVTLTLRYYRLASFTPVPRKATEQVLQ